jgi:cysteine-rich repeat protein
MNGKIRGMTLLTAAVLAVPLGLWYASAGCATAETDDVVPRCSATGGCGDRCVDRLRGEQCDDGNRAPGDGCSPACQLESAPDGGDTTPPTDDAGDTTPPRDDAGDATPPRDDGGGTDTGSCPESPCRLRPSCGCPAGQKCTVDFTLLPDELVKQCGPAGSGSSSAICTSDEECMAGTVCSGLYSAAGLELAMCGDYCNGDSDCSGAGSVCMPMLSSGAYPGSCTHACDLVTNAGCPSGTACKALVMTLGTTEKPMTDCGADVGSGTQGSSCSDDSGCRAGYFCVDADGDTVQDQCIGFCKVATSVCPGGLTCNPWDDPIIFGTTEYGYCW